MPASTSQKNMNKEKEPIFRYWDQFNSVYSENSDKFKSLSEFFNQYDKAKTAGNNPTLEQCIGRKDQNDELLFAGDIIKVSYDYPGHYYLNHEDGDSGHFIGVIRYQPSKGFVISRIIQLSDAETEYKRKPGAMQFSTSHSTKIGNINQHPYLIKEGIKQ